VSIWDDLKDIGDGVKDMAWNQAKSFTGVVYAPAGLVWDIATSPKDFQRDLLTAGGRVTDPLMNDNTFTGRALGPVLEGAMWVGREGISEPVSTLALQLGHSGREGTGFLGDYSNFFSADDWSTAYDRAQTTSMGQAIVLGIGSDDDPFATEDPYEEWDWHENHPFLSSVSTGTLDAAFTWYLDPFVVAGKGVKAAKALSARPITIEDARMGIRETMEKDARSKAGVIPFIDGAGLGTRMDRLTGTVEDGVYKPGWLEGKTAMQILHGWVDLDKMPRATQVANLFAETNKIENAAERINTQRTIMQVLLGDRKAFNELKETRKSISDVLENMEKGTVNGAQAGVIWDDAATKLPQLFPAGSKAENIVKAEDQIASLPALQNALQAGERWAGDLQDAYGTLTHIPRATNRGDRRLARMTEGAGMLRSGKANTKIGAVLDPETGKTVSKYDDFLDSVFSRPLETLYQASPSRMPVRMIHGLVVNTLHAGPRFTDSFSNLRPEYVVNVNDADDTYRNVDAYLRKAGMDAETRAKFGDELANANEPYKRYLVIKRAEIRAKQELFRKYGLDPDDPAVDAVLRESYRRGERARNALQASTQGAAYAAVEEAGGSMRMHQINYMRKKNGEPPLEHNLRIDQIDNEGVPTAVPFLDTQDMSLVAMMPLDDLDYVLKRYNNVFRATARALKDDQSVSALKRDVGGALTFGLQTKDRLSDLMLPILDMVNRTWKFSVLLRLGYLQRVLLDDHMRMAAAHGAHTFVMGMKEGSTHFAYNNTIRPFKNRQLERQLRTELDEKLDHVGDDASFALNQEAWATIKKNTKRLEQTGAKKLKSAKRIKELEDERDVLLQMHPEDLSKTKEEIAELEKVLTDKTYRLEKVYMGENGTAIKIDGQEYWLPGAFEGDYGQIFKGLNSSRGSYIRTVEGSTDRRQANLAKSGSYETIVAKENPERHLQAWAYAVNFHLRNSELADIIIKGGTVKDVRRFLSTPRGRELRRKFPWNGGNPDRWAHEVGRMVDQYLPPEIRAIAAERRVNAHDLRTLAPDVDARPMVHGASLDANLGTGQVAFSLNAPINKFYKWIGNRNDQMSRHPLFISLYKEEQARQMLLRLDEARKAGRKLDQDDFEVVAHNAREHARKGVNRVLFDMAGTTEMAHFMRFIAPFFGAWQEGLNRWWRIVSKDPSVAARFFMLFDAPRNLGIVVDSETGELVDPGSPISDKHMILFQLPKAWGGKDPVEGKDAYQTNFKVSEASFNLIFQGGGLLNPGFGPMVQVPVNQYAVAHADDGKLQESIKAIMPFGTASDPTQLFLPASVRAGWTVASAKFFGHHSRQYIQMQNMIWRDDLVKFEQEHGRPPTTTEANKLMKEAGRKTTDMASLKWITTVTSPAAVQIQSEFAPQLFAYRRLAEQARVEKKPPFWADQQFIEQWGDAFFPLTQSSNLNRAGLGSTQGTVGAIKRYRGTLDLIDPSLYRMVISGEGEGTYDQTSRNYLYSTQLQPGSDDTFVGQADPRDAMENTLVAQGWADYNAMTNKLNVDAQAQGFIHYAESDWYLEAKKRGLQELAARNPTWYQEYSTFNSAEYEKSVEGMRVIAADKKLLANPRRTDVKVLGEYLSLRDQITAVLKARGDAGGSSSPSAQSNADVLRVYTQAVNRMAESDLWFESYMYDGFIDRDPYLLENVTPEVSASGIA